MNNVLLPTRHYSWYVNDYVMNNRLTLEYISHTISAMDNVIILYLNGDVDEILSIYIVLLVSCEL
jgi:hypothetical protein